MARIILWIHYHKFIDSEDFFSVEIKWYDLKLEWDPTGRQDEQKWEKYWGQ